MKARTQVSVRGTVYDRIAAVAKARGMRITDLVEQAVAQVGPEVASSERRPQTVDHAPVEG